MKQVRSLFRVNQFIRYLRMQKDVSLAMWNCLRLLKLCMFSRLPGVCPCVWKRMWRMERWRWTRQTLLRGRQLLHGRSQNWGWLQSIVHRKYIPWWRLTMNMESLRISMAWLTRRGVISVSRLSTTYRRHCGKVKVLNPVIWIIEIMWEILSVLILLLQRLIRMNTVKP